MMVLVFEGRKLFVGPFQIQIFVKLHYWTGIRSCYFYWVSGLVDVDGVGADFPHSHEHERFLEHTASFLPATTSLVHPRRASRSSSQT